MGPDCTLGMILRGPKGDFLHEVDHAGKLPLGADRNGHRQ